MTPITIARPTIVRTMEPPLLPTTWPPWSPAPVRSTGVDSPDAASARAGKAPSSSATAATVAATRECREALIIEDDSEG
jgi:hypothetical protein